MLPEELKTSDVPGQVAALSEAPKVAAGPALTQPAKLAGYSADDLSIVDPACHITFPVAERVSLRPDLARAPSPQKSRPLVAAGGCHSAVYTLNSVERDRIDAIIRRLSAQFDSIETSDFLRACTLEVANLPRRLLSFLINISSNVSTEGVYMVSGFDIDDTKIGDTPIHWDAPWSGTPCLREEIYQCLLSTALGNLFGWRTQENGRILRHVVPIPSDAKEQLGGSSATTLLWHTEEAFHVGRADFLSLFCYRNNEMAETNLANVRQLSLSDQTRRLLSEKRFYIEPDKSHLPENNASIHWQMNPDQFSRIHDQRSQPQNYAILHGTAESPLMVVDQAFMSVKSDDVEAQVALDEFHRALDLAAVRLVMKPGDLLIIDNLTTAHGRSVYKPQYGPKQRWLRRVNIRNGRRAFSDYAEAGNDHVMI